MNVRDHIVGFTFVFGVAALSFCLSTYHASFDALVTSLIIGMLAGNIVGFKDSLEKGSEAALNLFLPLGVALYGFQMVLNEFEPGLLTAIFLVISGLFGLTMLLSVIFDVKRDVGILIASGLALCGASAIAVVSSLIGAKKEETSISLLSVLLLGLAGTIIYPFFYDLLALTQGEFGFLAGATLPIPGHVRIVAEGVSPESLFSALKNNSIRMSFLLILVVASIFQQMRKEKGMKAPWFAVAFIVFAVAANVTKVFVPVLVYLKGAGNFCLSTSLAAVGVLVDLDLVVEEGITPVGVIFFSLGVVVLLIYFFRNLF